MFLNLYWLYIFIHTFYLLFKNVYVFLIGYSANICFFVRFWKLMVLLFSSLFSLFLLSLGCVWNVFLGALFQLLCYIEVTFWVACEVDSSDEHRISYLAANTKENKIDMKASVVYGHLRSIFCLENRISIIVRGMSKHPEAGLSTGKSYLPLLQWSRVG